MDPSSIPAAGSRPAKMTHDQAPPTREIKYNSSSIFGGGSDVQTTPQRTQTKTKSDIFSSQPVPQKSQEIRANNNTKSQIFNYDQSNTNTHTAAPRQSQTFANSQKETKGFQAKAAENRPQDHGSNFLFGKSDFDDYKSLKRVSTAKEFRPKLEYDPVARKYQDLHGGEIGKDHLPAPANKPSALQQQSVKKQTTNQDADPQTRKLLENSSSVFGEQVVQISPTKGEKLTASNAKWQSESQAVDNSVKEFDPDTYAKQKKEKELESTIFGQPVKVVKAKSNGNPTKEEQKDRKPGVPVQNKPKDRLIPTNQTWQQTDTVKNMKDFNPSESQVDINATPSQKKFDTLKSTFDTHDFQPTPDVPVAEKISTKGLKYKSDILSREDKAAKKANQKAVNTQQQQKPKPKPKKQDDDVI